MANVRMVFAHGVLSSDPNHSLERRWPLGATRFMNAIEARALDLLKLRREKIKKSNDICRDKKRCVSGSEEHASLQTESEVSGIYNLEWLVRSYSGFYPTEQEKFNLLELVLSDGLLNLAYSGWKVFLRDC